MDWHQLEATWQARWEDLGKATVHKNKEKFMMIFAYPGISGFLHVGHLRGYSYTDAICRYERLKGKEVLFPIGTHASGNHAFSLAKKIKDKDADFIKYLLDNGCPQEKIEELKDPEKIIEYFNKVYVEDYWKKFGFIADWERFTCTTNKDYEKFIQWQFKKLQQKDLLVQKPYFATACVNCGPVAVDPSETDISKGGNAEKVEYTLLKFKIGNDTLVAATLRPETVYGQTNLWVNPDAGHVRIEVDGENWIMSKEAAEKLRYQKDELILKEDVDIKAFIGRNTIAPGANREIPILPANFCDPKIGTGIVTSVPSHAPYDWIGLEDLKNDKETCLKYGLDIEDIREIQPIALIKVEGYSIHPAKELCEKYQITSQKDTQKLEEAKHEIYKAEFHSGIMLDNCDKYAGKKVEEAKELIKAELISQGKADILYDLSEEVICRCGAKVIVKRIDDQWFIKYSDQELTERSKEQAKEMRIYPKEYYDSMPKTLEWFGDRACARLGNWMGSRLPFDNRWIIEPISDSTLYPAYYIVSKFVNQDKVKTEELTEEFFDFVFLGKGTAQNSIWKEVREEFNYFYPLDINLGGKEHQTVHFPVFLMNHVAILAEEKWPKGIFVNWWVTGKGSKISKSKGGAVPIPQAIEKYGVDAMRFYYAHIASPHVDVVWDEDIVINYKNALERIHTLVTQLHKVQSSKQSKTASIDQWLQSRFQKHLHHVHEAMKEYQLRELASVTYFSIYDDLKWYLRLGGAHQKVIAEVLNFWLILMNPITPHLSEDLNHLNGGRELVSLSAWPSADQSKMSLKAEYAQEFIAKTLEGMRTVQQLAKLEKPSHYTLFVADSWLYSLYSLLAKEIKVTRNMAEIMRRVLEQEDLRCYANSASKVVTALLKGVSKMPSLVTSQEEEAASLQEAKEFLEQECGSKVEIILAQDSQDLKARSALPGKVGIVVR